MQKCATRDANVASLETSGKAGAGVCIHFSTAEVPLADRRDAWLDVTRRFSGPSIVDFGSSQFDGRFVSGKVGDFRCARVKHTARFVERSHRELSCVDPDYYYLYLQMTGQTVVSQDRRQAHLLPGEITLLDSSRPSTLRFGEAEEHLTVFIPREDLKQRMSGHPLRLASGVRGAPAALLSSLIRSAFSAQHSFSMPQNEAVRDCLLGFVAATWQDSDKAFAAEEPAQPLLALIQNYMLGRLDNPSLSPELVAKAHNISVRYVHRLFSAAGTSLCEWLREKRLERCAADLRDPALSAEHITQIAFRWGFNEAAHFSRSFKAVYRCSPRQYRAS